MHFPFRQIAFYMQIGTFLGGGLGGCMDEYQNHGGIVNSEWGMVEGQKSKVERHVDGRRYHCQSWVGENSASENSRLRCVRRVV